MSNRYPAAGRALSHGGALLVLLALFGCTSTAEMIREDRDPFEGYNRFMFKVNDSVDKAVLKPVAQGYDAITPPLLDDGITNVFNNLGGVVVVVNDILQAKFGQAVEDTTRVVYNTVFGIGGFFDVATHMGLPKNNEDFGQTLGRWGVGEGYYLVLPLLGPSTTRDVWRIPVDGLFNPNRLIQGFGPVSADQTQLALRVLEIVDTRAGLLSLERTFDAAAIDPYSFQRSAYLQRRRNLVFDGNPPRPEFDLDALEEMDDNDGDDSDL